MYREGELDGRYVPGMDGIVGPSSSGMNKLGNGASHNPSLVRFWPTRQWEFCSIAGSPTQQVLTCTRTCDSKGPCGLLYIQDNEARGETHHSTNVQRSQSSSQDLGSRTPAALRTSGSGQL